MKKQGNTIMAGLILTISAGMFSCEDLLNNIQNGDELTTEEVIDGLKTALKVGTDSAVSVVSLTDGYFKDELIKIPLPSEASVITDHLDDPIFQTAGVSSLLEGYVEDVVLSVNRAAEEAAKGAAPIFRDAITDLSISDAWAILHGSNPAEGSTKSGAAEFDSTAATAYLKSTTIGDLTTLFADPMNKALDKDLGLGFSANGAWDLFTGTYNDVAGSIAGQFAGLETVDTDLGAFAVGKALDGLFYKVGKEEVKIRRDPLAWASTAVGNILEKVFGSGA